MPIHAPKDGMTAEEFVIALEELGWKQSDFCRMADVDKNTPSRWVNGVTPIPGWAARFLAMALEIKRLSGLIDPKMK
jgi:transcriptional regulator with XRE-family HTH domain